jgi:hypothetical protein
MRSCNGKAGSNGLIAGISKGTAGKRLNRMIAPIE